MCADNKYAVQTLVFETFDDGTPLRWYNMTYYMADIFAENKLIDPEQYKEFREQRRFDVNSIKNFAKSINRDPGIVVGRLQNDREIGYTDRSLNMLRQKYKVVL